MLTVIFILIIGIAFGNFFKRKESFIKTVDKLLLWSIYLLLFLLGISVGSNQTIIQNFAEIGFKAIMLSLSGVAVSIFLSYFVYRFFWKKNEK